MEKTKLGISVELASALMFLLCLFGGYIPALVFGGYLLLNEENIWLKKNALGALILLVLFSSVLYLIDLVPGVIYVIDDFVGLFGGSCQAGGLKSFISLLNNALSILKTALFLFFSLRVLKGKNIKLPFVQKIVEGNL